VSVACGIAVDKATAGCARVSPTTITRKTATMNAIVGTMKIRAASAIPHIFAAVIRASTARHIQTRAPYSEGNAAVSASTPADTPTAAFST
jgi:hypothetical protein